MSNFTIPTTIIEPRKGWIPIDLTEIWNYRELLYFLTKRDIKVRYKQTVLGGLWAIIQPVFTMVVFTLFFGRLAKCLLMASPIPSLFMQASCRGPILLMPYPRLETVSLEALIS